MSTTFTCPHCRRESDYGDIQMDADLMAIIKMTPVFGKNDNLVWAYCELFGIRPLSSRRKKLRLLLEEMKALFQAEGFFYQKKQYRINQAGIASALSLMTHKHWESNMENHNYLKKIMIGIAETDARTESKEAEKDLRKKEAALMSRCGRHPTIVSPSRDGEIINPKVNNSAGSGLQPEPNVNEEGLRKVRKLLETIGG